VKPNKELVRRHGDPRPDCINKGSGSCGNQNCQSSCGALPPLRGSATTDSAGNQGPVFQSGARPEIDVVMTCTDLCKWKTPLERKITVNRRKRTCTINLAYPYEVDLDRVPDLAALLRWALHLCHKTWMTTDALSLFIEKVSEFKKFDIHKLD